MPFNIDKKEFYLISSQIARLAAGDFLLDTPQLHKEKEASGILKALNLLSEELREKYILREDYETLLESVSDFVFIVNEDFLVKKTNKKTNELFGGEHKILNKPISKLLRLYNYLVEYQEKEVETELLLGKGLKFPVSITCRRITTLNLKSRGFIFLAKDLRLHKSREKKIHSYEATLHQLHQRLLDLQEEERKKIAHEVHDNIGQMLAALKFQLISLASKQKIQGFDRSLFLLDQTIQQVRALFRELRPLGLNEGTLVESMKNYLQRILGEASITVSFTVDPHVDRLLCSDISLILFRVFQELVINVLKHAQASKICVYLKRSANDIVLEVEDDGIGIGDRDQSSTSLGLLGIKERLVRANGSYHFFQICELGGTCMRVSLPLVLPKPCVKHPVSQQG